MSIAEPGAIWRVIEALHRPIDQPIGPIQITTADADWLRDLLLSIAATEEVRDGRPRESRHIGYVAMDVEMRIRASQKTRKAVFKSVIAEVARDWNETERKVEDWERKERQAAIEILNKFDHSLLAPLISHHRKLFLEKIAS